MVVDATALVAAGLGGIALAQAQGGRVAAGWIWSGPILMMLALLARETSARGLRAMAGVELRTAVTFAAVSAMAVALLALLAGADPRVLQEVVLVGLLAGAGVGTARVSLAFGQAVIRRQKGPTRRTLIVGSGHIGHLVAQRLLANPGLDLEPVGFLDKDPRDDRAGLELPVFGASWDLERTVAQQDIEVVIVAFSTAPHHVPLTIVRRCWELGVQAILVPRLFEVQGLRAHTEHIGGLPLVALNPADPRGWQLALRYGFDRLSAAMLLLAISPLLGAIALAVRLTMGRPILFRQERMGRDGRIFEMLKFRTMRGDPKTGGEADAGWAAQALNGSAGGVIASGHGAGASSANGHGTAAGAHGPEADPGAAKRSTSDRRTPLGSVLRRLSLDELPQLWNVVCGDMALIGPRPERASYADEFQRAVYRYRDRARIKPGITGWAQVNGLRGQTSLADRVEWDNFYIENWSPWLDAKIAFLTLARARTPDA